MSKKATSSTKNIVSFFERVRRDSGLQGLLLGEVAHAAPELLAKIAGEHGHKFSPDDLKELLKDRAARSMQGEVFWLQVLSRLPNGGDGGVPFGQIKGPSWVNQAPYRKELPAVPEKTETSLSDLFHEIESEAR